MQSTWELSRNKVLLAIIISVLMPRLMARHVWEGCVCNWTLSQMFRWCLKSPQSHLWTRTCLWLWSTGPNLGFPPGIHLRWPFWWSSCYILFSFAQQGKRPFLCAVSFSAWYPLVRACQWMACILLNWRSKNCTCSLVLLPYSSVSHLR